MPMELLGSVDNVTLRGLVGFALLAWLGWVTVDRARGDTSDPSVSLGGDWILLRASGMALVGLVIIVAAALLTPWLNGGLTLLLAGVFAFWGISKLQEGR